MAYEAEDMEPEEGVTQEPVVDKLDVINCLDQINVAEEIDGDELDRIGMRVIEDYEIDVRSRSEWEQTHKQGMELAKLVSKDKTFPFDGSSNVIYPMIIGAAIQFHARAYPNIIQGQNVVKSKSVGKDPEGFKSARGMRVAEFMNWQLLEQSLDWEDSLDKALLVLPIVGCFFRKTYLSAVLGQNVSKVVYAENLVVNNTADSLESASRISELIEFRPNEYEENVRAGNFLRIEIGEDTGNDGVDEQSEDNDVPHLFIEQHRWLDLDGDGYQEPYIVTVHKATSKVVRISCRFKMKGVKTEGEGKNAKIIKINPDSYYTKFSFIPAPDGSFYDWGFNQLLSPINRAANSILNQLIDAGTLHNTGGGLIDKGIALKTKNRDGKNVRFQPGEWKSVSMSSDDLRKGFVPLPTKEPSMVLFQLLGFMIDAGDKLSSVTDALQGEQTGSNVPAATTLAMIEQGMKVFTAIYKRIYRSEKKEFKKLYELNRLYGDQDEYVKVLDEDASIEEDFGEDYDVYPVGDPNETSDMQKIMKAQALMQLLGQGFNDEVIRRRVLEAMSIPDIEELTQNVPQLPPPPEVLIKNEEFNIEKRKLDLEERKVAILERKAPFEAGKIHTASMRDIADAESKEPGEQLGMYHKALMDMQEENLRLVAALEQQKGVTNGNEQSGLPPMGAGPGDDSGIQDPGVPTEQPQGGLMPGIDPNTGQPVSNGY